MLKKGQLVVRLNWNIFVIILNKSIGIIYHNYIALHFVYSIYLTLILLKKKGMIQILGIVQGFTGESEGEKSLWFSFLTHSHAAGNVMHLVSSGVQHHLISQPAQVAVQSAANAYPANTSTALPANRLPHNASAQGW